MNLGIETRGSVFVKPLTCITNVSDSKGIHMMSPLKFFCVCSSTDREAIVQLKAAADSELLAWEAESKLGDRREVQIAQG
jgi:hypothetical protein